MPRISFAVAPIALVSLLLAACSTPEGDFPSLQKRAYETDNPVEEPADTHAEIATALDPAIKAKADSLRARYRAGQAAFDKGLPEIRKLAAGAAGAKPGTETWVNAHLQLSRLDKARFESVAALTAIDDLVSDTENLDLNGGPAQAPLLAPIQKEIATGTGAQNDMIDQLSRQIGE